MDDRTDNLWKAAFESCPIPLVVMDESGAAVLANGPALKLVGILASPATIFGPETWSKLADGTGPATVVNASLSEATCPAYTCATALRLAVPGQNLVLVILMPRSACALLSPGAKKPTVDSELVLRVIEYQQKFVDQEKLALTDTLTGTLNRRAFDTTLETMIAESRDSGEPISLLILDIDHFKSLNDTYGHQEGDRALAGLGELLRSMARSIDRVARLGGEEFAVILPLTTGEQARQVAERLREAIESATLCASPFTASFGVTTSEGGSLRPEDAYRQADQALYRAKQTGRNRVVHSDDLMHRVQRAA